MTQDALLAIIEDPKGSLTHVELDPTTRDYKVVREFTIPWPFHYGSLKDTHVEVDHDALDIAVFSELEVQRGQEMIVRIIGALLVKDGDHKILAVCPDDMQFRKCFEYVDIPENLRAQGEKVFQIDHTIERILNAEEAMKLIERYRI